MTKIILAIQWLIPFLRPRHEHATFEGREIRMDLADYHHCMFKNCTMIYGGGPINFTHNHMDGCRIVLDGTAAHTLIVLRHFHSIAPEMIDGTFKQPLRRAP